MVYNMWGVACVLPDLLYCLKGVQDHEIVFFEGLNLSLY